MAKGKQGLASMDDQTKHRVQSAGGKASGKSTSTTTGSSSRGAAGKTEAAKRGGQH